jgi:hypothetical protein
MWRRALLAAAAAILWMPAASATMIITADTGGSIHHYERLFSTVRATGEYVVIDGRCFSACTMVLGLVPPERVCVTSRAQLGFHAAWFPDMAGGRVISAQHTQKLHSLYPPPVRNWIRRRGGLSIRMIVLAGRELRAMLPACRQAGTPGLATPPGRQTAAAGQHLEMSTAGKGLGRGL